MKFALLSLAVTLLTSIAARAETLAFKDASAEITWLNGPKVMEDSRFRIEWSNRAGAFDPTAFIAKLFMPDMNHGSAPTGNQRVLDKAGKPVVGAYDVSNVYFTMGGDWEVRVTLTNEKGVKETKAFKVSLPDGGGHHP